MTKIKICGITEVEHALAAAQAGVEFIGLVFAPSRRQVSVEKACQIAAAVRELNPRPEIVGVFANANIAHLNQVADYLRLDWVQLSGNETIEYCKLVDRPIIKAVHISSDNTAYEIAKIIESGYKSLPGCTLLYLLDTKVEGCYGGTGQTFEWKIAEELSRHFPIIVAGGLTPDNVATLVTRAKPFGVDVSSGVESGGKKDVTKIVRFVQAVKEAETTGGCETTLHPDEGGNSGV
jgi:phosphoribosylanthranilate isomerase